MVGQMGEKALNAYPGPAFILNATGAVIAANARADSLKLAIVQGLINGAERFAQWTSDIQSGPNPAVVECLPAPSGGSIYIELVGLPLMDGTVLVVGRDVTLERNLRAALVESRQRYKDLVEISSDFAWETSSDGRFVFVSPKGALGYAPEDLVGRHPSEFVIHQGPNSGVSAFAASLPVTDMEVWVRDSKGKDVCLLVSATPLVTEDRRWNGARGVCRDVTEQRVRDAALLRAHNRERLLTYVVRTIRDEVEPTDMLRAAAESTGRALNATCCQIFRAIPGQPGFTLAAQYGTGGDESPVLAYLTQSDHFDQQLGGWHVLATVSRYRHSVNGAVCLWRPLERTGWSDDDRLLIDDVSGQVGLATEQIANHERILMLSRTDALTGLFNRRAFFEELQRRYQRLARDKKPATLIYCDLDNFKWVNDVHGHQVGDQALLAVRDMLLHHTRPVDLVARLGGDEFAVWLEGADEAAALSRCKAINEGAATLERYSGSSDRPLHVSLGAAVHQAQSGESLDDLLARADHAMYEVKREGKGAWRIAATPYPKDRAVGPS